MENFYQTPTPNHAVVTAVAHKTSSMIELLIGSEGRSNLPGRLKVGPRGDGRVRASTGHTVVGVLLKSSSCWGSIRLLISGVEGREQRGILS